MSVPGGALSRLHLAFPGSGPELSGNMGWEARTNQLGDDTGPCPAAQVAGRCFLSHVLLLTNVLRDGSGQPRFLPPSFSS